MLAFAFLTIFLGFAAILSFSTGLPSEKREDVAGQRLRRLTRTRQSGLETRSLRARLRDLTVAIGSRVRGSRALPENGKLRRKLTLAGFSDPVAYDGYALARIMAVPLGIGGGALLPHARLFGMAAGVVLCSLLLPVSLSHLTRRRKDQIRRSVPDLIDLLVICVDAGLGLDQAVMRVAQELALSHPAMHEELMRVAGEQRAGKPRMQAWQDMAADLSIPELDDFIAMLVQADRFGTPISRALSTFAARVRWKRTQAAEEQAAKTTIKILFPLVLFLFPTIFIVLLGPAVLTTIRAFSGGLK